LKRKNEKKGLSSKAKKKLMAEARVRKGSSVETRAEYRLRQRTDWAGVQATKRLKEYRKITRNIKRTIELLFGGEDIPGLHGVKGRLARIALLNQNIKNPSEREVAKRLLLALENNKSKILECDNYHHAIRSLVRGHSRWLRQPEDWVPESKNPHKQFSSLLRHLLAKYSVPLFMDSVWLQVSAYGLSLRQGWWIHVATGGNIRTAKSLPVPLTKKMAHFMMQAPKDYSVDAAIRWGQIHALGGNERNVRGLRGSFLCQGDFTNDAFWQSVFRFFISQPMLDSARYGPICDYLKNQKFIIARGAETAPQPNLSMKGRDPNTLLTQVDAWHTRLIKEKGKNSWERHKVIGDFTLTEGKKENTRTYHVVELLSSKELRDEGKRLSHCVASYARSCAAGTTSIFSVRKDQGSGLWEPMGTIEVRNSSKQIVQFSAKYNRRPDFKAYQIMKRWAIKWNLTLSGWV
jgi:hypothetical protein